MKSKSESEHEFDRCQEFFELWGWAVAAVVWAAIMLVAACCSGCGGPAFEENLFGDTQTQPQDSGSAPDTTPATDSDAGEAPRIDGGTTDGPAVDAGPEAPTSPPDACPTHYDGFGDTFSDCTTPGTYTSSLAFEACVAAGGSVTLNSPQGTTCTNEDPSPCADKSGYVQWTRSDGGGCISWAWSGDLVGQTFTNCGCPTGPAHSTWR